MTGRGTDLPAPAATKTCPRCAEEVKVAALVCRYCGHEFAPAVPPPPPPGTPVAEGPPGPGWAPPQPSAPSVPRPAGSRRSHASLRLVAVLVVLVVTIVALASFVSSRMRGAAADPGALAAKFSAAGITCRSLDVIFDTRSSKALGCAGTDGHIITITTYGARPSAADWQRARCNAAAQPRDGAYVAGDGFIIDIRQGPYPSELLGEPASPIDAARRLVTVLGGAAATYACP